PEQYDDWPLRAARRHTLPGGSLLQTEYFLMLSFHFASFLAGSNHVTPDSLPSRRRNQELQFDAGRIGHDVEFEPLFSAAADVNAPDKRGFTPLILAAYAGQLETAEALIAAGADACKPDTKQGNTAQMGVAFKGEDAMAARLLKADCDVNARNKAGQTALMMAALFNRSNQIEMLLAAGADAAIADASGRTAASVAQAQGNEAVADRLGN